ncbi:hypothetical protein DBV15_05766, partial [Temnothorax longispinosus]
MAEQNLNRGIELHSKAQALSVAFPLGGRGAATAFPPSVPLHVHQLTMLPHGSGLLLFPLYAGSANNKTTPEPQSPFDDPDGLPHIAWHVHTHSCASRGIVNVVISCGSTCDRTKLGYNAPCNLKSQALHHRDRHERKLGIARGLSIHIGFFLRHVRIVDPSPISNLSPSCPFTNADYCRFSISGVDKMSIVCVICSDLLAPSDDVFHTPCGHIFHFTCLIQWLERSKTCPQCRDRTIEQTIRRIYFNFSNSDNIAEDADASLQNRIDSLILQLKLRDENLKLTEANGKLETQTAGLKQEVRNFESEMKGKNSVILALKEQIKFYKQQCSDANNYRKENEHLKKNLQHLKNVQSRINSSRREVDDKIMMTSDFSKLTTHIAVLKKELKHMSNKSRE